ncbi:MAG: chemotaxis protein CheW [SAR324 cluster bacterium]|nr:chemotaxis protein CheW [SAR324 cluster bacterium]
MTFNVGSELFGVRIEIVQQIIRPPQITAIPRTPGFFLGVLNLRGETISTIDLRVRFSMGKAVKSAETRVIIVDYRHSRLGLLVDRMGSVLNINNNQIRTPSPFIEKNTLEYLSGTVQIDAKKSLLLLDADRLMAPEDFRLGEVIIRSDKTGQGGELVVAEPEQVLIGFKLADEYYLMEINIVEEIIRSPTAISEVPQHTRALEGVFHLRDQIIPLLRLTKRFGLPDQPDGPNTAVLVVNVLGVKIGLIVDAITGVKRLRESNIEPLPKNVEASRSRHLKGVFQSKDNGQHFVYLVTILEKIFLEDELERLGDFQDAHMQEMLESAKPVAEIMSLLRFKVGGEIYAIRILQVNQITNMQTVCSVPMTPDYIKGVMNVRGEIITVLDLSTMFGSTEMFSSKKAKIIVVDIGERKVGLQVEEVIGIVFLPRNIFDIPENWGERGEHRLVEAIGREESGDVTVLLDLDATLKQATEFGQHFKKTESEMSMA